MNIKTGRFEITAITLKYIAIITMIINHTCVIVMGKLSYTGFWYYAQWYATRLSFVIFAFLTAEGIYRTSNRYNYCLRLACLALISEIPYDLCFKNQIFVPNHYNIAFTLFLGVVAIEFIDKYDAIWKKLIICLTIMLIGFHISYNVVGMAIILSFYFLRKKPVVMFLVITFFLAMYYPFAMIEKLPQYNYNLISYLNHFNWKGKLTNCELLGGILAYPLICMYKGKKGNTKLPRWFFWSIYPAHMIILIIVSKIL